MEQLQRLAAGSSPEAAVQDGHTLYELEDLIGRGAYGSVHRATHKQTGQVVALKVRWRALAVFWLFWLF